MSFSRAKRFNYKPPDVYCSPADYLLNLGLEKGYSMPKCPRFQNCRSDDEDSIICSKLLHTHCVQSNEENNHCVKHDKKMLNRKFPEFDRNDARRKSIKSSKNDDRTKTWLLSTNKHFDEDPLKMLCEAEEFFDDDYGSMASSEALDNLKDLEEYEFSEVYSAVKRIKDRRLAASKRDNTFDFERIVLKKLESIDRNVKIIKEDVEYSPKNAYVGQLHYHYRSNGDHSLNRNRQQDLRSVIVRTVQNLRKNFETKRRSMLRHSQGHVLDIIDEMYATSDKSSAQIKDLCSGTAEELITNINKVLQDSICDENEIDDKLEEFVNQYYASETIHKLNSKPLQNLISDYLVQTQEVGEELEDDLSDITLKCTDTQQMLHVQGVLLDEMKNKIENLKSGMCEN